MTIAPAPPAPAARAATAARAAASPTRRRGPPWVRVRIIVVRAYACAHLPLKPKQPNPTLTGGEARCEPMDESTTFAHRGTPAGPARAGPAVALTTEP